MMGIMAPLYLSGLFCEPYSMLCITLVGLIAHIYLNCI